MKKAYISASAGKHLTDYLSDAGYEVVSVDGSAMDPAFAGIQRDTDASGYTYVPDRPLGKRPDLPGKYCGAGMSLPGKYNIQCCMHREIFHTQPEIHSA